MSKLLAVAMIVLSGTGVAAAAIADNDHMGDDFYTPGRHHWHAEAAPEMDGAGTAAALLLLGGGMIVLFGRRGANRN